MRRNHVLYTDLGLDHLEEKANGDGATEIVAGAGFFLGEAGGAVDVKARHKLHFDEPEENKVGKAGRVL